MSARMVPAGERFDFVRLERSWIRRDSSGSTHCAGPDDRSPEHATYPRGYDSRCGWCYLNAPHTSEAHAQQIPAQPASPERAIGR